MCSHRSKQGGVRGGQALTTSDERGVGGVSYLSAKGCGVPFLDGKKEKFENNGEKRVIFITKAQKTSTLRLNHPNKGVKSYINIFRNGKNPHYTENI
jgi:hypothetical protein